MPLNNVNLNYKIRVGFGASFIVLLISSVLSFMSIKKLIEQSRLVDHTNEISIKLEKIFSTIKDSETSQRGYLLTKNTDFKEQFQGTFEDVQNQYLKLAELTRDNKVQQNYLDSLNLYIKKRYQRLNFALEDFDQHNQVINPSLLGRGKYYMEGINKFISQMQDEERRLLEIRSNDAEEYSTLAPLIILLSSMFAITLSLLSFYFISRDIKTRDLMQKDIDDKNYVLEGLEKLNDLLRGEKNLKVASQKILSHICEYTKATGGLLYAIGNDGRYKLSSLHGIKSASTIIQTFESKDGLLGQAVSTKKNNLLTHIEGTHLRIETGIATVKPAQILIVPFYLNEEVVAVAEILNKDHFSKRDVSYIENLSSTVTIFINNIKAEEKTLELLSETQSQAEELEAQQEEMRQMNDELREQRDMLQASEEELRASEEELQEKNAELEMQYETLKEKNQVLENARQAVQLKVQQVETVSKYKTDFLSNMSHELRTPLNSILILSSLLKENKAKRLTNREVEQAAIIEKSGNDLLKLINEILDLSRIESGKVSLELREYTPSNFDLYAEFKDVAKEKNINFTTVISPDLPEKIVTDKFRVEQILKNLLSNAFKFTPEGGSVTFSINGSTSSFPDYTDSLNDTMICFSVQDSGIGISEDKKNLIFEAFQQADPSTTRKYGGTGLGLTISRDLAKLLGGNITVDSVPGKGSTFTFCIPVKKADGSGNDSVLAGVIPAISKKSPAKKESAKNPSLAKYILVVEDDVYFSNIISDFAKQKGFDVISTSRGEETIDLAIENNPVAILLDVQLPDANGWDILRKIKSIDSLKHIPVHVMSAYDVPHTIEEMGQETFLPKPISLDLLDKAFNQIALNNIDRVSSVLVVEDNQIENEAIKELLNSQEIDATSAYTGDEALKLLSENDFDCVILDIRLPDQYGFNVLKQIRENKVTKNIPVIIYSGKDISEEEETRFKKYTDVIIIKTEHSYTRLLDEVKLFIHNMNSNLQQSPKVTSPHTNDSFLQDKKVLLADDDIRNIFSLTSFLEDQGMIVVAAYNGKQAIEELEANKVDLVLMDIMMPELDGIEATKIIRTKPQYKDLPIIALTAKAMPGDRESCLEAGVSDYISKPIDLNKLLSLLRVWIYKN